MTHMSYGRVVATFGTRNIRTVVRDTGNGRYIWMRRTGTDAPAPLARPEDRLRARIRAAIPLVGVSVQFAEDSSEPLCYEMTGSVPAAAVLRTGRADIDSGVADLLRAVGAALRALHELPAVAGLPHVPPGVIRARDWFAGGGESVSAQRLWSLAHDRLGTHRMEHLREFTERVNSSSANHSVLHGNPALAQIVPSEGSGDGTLIMGEDVCNGDPVFDVSWLIGEIAELHDSHKRGMRQIPGADYTLLGWSFLQGYGSIPEADTLAKVSALRTMVHAHDYASYVGWHDDLREMLDIVGERLDGTNNGLFDEWRDKICT